MNGASETKPATADEILTVPELAARLKLKPRTIYHYIEAAQLTRDDGLVAGNGVTRIYWPKFLERYLAGECGFQTRGKRSRNADDA